MKKKAETVKAIRSSSNKPLVVLLLAAIVIVTWFSLSPALKNGLINWDDNAYVFENKQLAKPIGESINYFFGPHYFIGNYIPVTMLVYAVEYHAAALDPQIYHKVNLLIHLANVLLVFWFIYLLSGRKLLVASVVSLFFGIHPMHVESVAWVSELKDVLYSLFFLAGLVFYLKYLESKNQKPGDKPVKDKYRFPVLIFLFFALSVLSKPAAIVFPLVLLLLDFYTGRKFDKWAWIEKTPLLIISIVFGIIAINSQDADKLLHDDHGLVQKIFFASHSLLEYVLKLVLPINLSIFYPYPPTADGQLPFSYYLAPILVALLCYGVYRTLKHTRLVAFGFLFFLVNIALVLQFISIGDAIMADRYTYISYIGLFFVIAMGLEKLQQGIEPKLRAYKAYVLPGIIILGLICSYQTHARCKVWKNDDTIATDLLNKYPDDRLALNNKGFIFYEQGKYNESIELFIKALQQKPDYTMASINLANSYFALSDYENALKTIEAALQHAPGNPNLLNQKGLCFHGKHKCREAIQFYQESIALKKDNVYSYIYLSQCYYDLKEYENSVKALDGGLKQEPGNHILLNNKGYTYFIMHKYREAAEYFKMALQLKPDYNTASVNLEDCYRAMRDSLQVKN